MVDNDRFHAEMIPGNCPVADEILAAGAIADNDYRIALQMADREPVPEAELGRVDLCPAGRLVLVDGEFVAVERLDHNELRYSVSVEIYEAHLAHLVVEDRDGSPPRHLGTLGILRPGNSECEEPFGARDEQALHSVDRPETETMIAVDRFEDRHRLPRSDELGLDEVGEDRSGFGPVLLIVLATADGSRDQIIAQRRWNGHDPVNEG